MVFKAIERKAVWLHRRFKDGGQRDTNQTTHVIIVLHCFEDVAQHRVSNPIVRSKAGRGSSGNSSQGVLMTLVPR